MKFSNTWVTAKNCECTLFIQLQEQTLTLLKVPLSFVGGMKLTQSEKDPGVCVISHPGRQHTCRAGVIACVCVRMCVCVCN